MDGATIPGRNEARQFQAATSWEAKAPPTAPPSGKLMTMTASAVGRPVRLEYSTASG